MAVRISLAIAYASVTSWCRNLGSPTPEMSDRHRYPSGHRTTTSNSQHRPRCTKKNRQPTRQDPAVFSPPLTELQFHRGDLFPKASELYDLHAQISNLFSDEELEVELISTEEYQRDISLMKARSLSYTHVPTARRSSAIRFVTSPPYEPRGEVETN